MKREFTLKLRPTTTMIRGKGKKKQQQARHTAVACNRSVLNQINARPTAHFPRRSAGPGGLRGRSRTGASRGCGLTLLLLHVRLLQRQCKTHSAAISIIIRCVLCVQRMQLSSACEHVAGCWKVV